MAVRAAERGEALEQYCASLMAAGLDAPSSRPGPLIEPLLRRSPEFMGPGRGAERRILRLANPGVPERTSTHTISVAVQYLLPGEVAPAHRHTPSAIRFMLRGEGAYTTVEGQPCRMRPGDLVITPSMTWHDHGNAGGEPVIWLDSLDSPLVRYLENLRMEPHAEEQQATRPDVERPIHRRWEAAHAALLERAAAPARP